MRCHIEGLEVGKICVGGEGVENGDNADVPDIIPGFSCEGSDVIVSFHSGALAYKKFKTVKTKECKKQAVNSEENRDTKSDVKYGWRSEEP